MGNVHFYAKIWWMTTNPFAMRRFLKIYFRL